MTDIAALAELVSEAFVALLDDVATGAPLPADAFPGRVDSYLARSAGGDCFLLIATSARANGTPIRYQALTVCEAARFTIRDRNTGEEFSQAFAYVQLSAGSTSLVSSFAFICALLLETIPANPVARRLVEFLDDFARLFAVRSALSRETVVGLWGELWILDQHSLDSLALGWRTHDGDRFDYSISSCRIEVKTTEGDARSHRFSLSQLAPMDRPTYIASLLVISDSAGRSIADLLSSILTRLGAAAASGVARTALETLRGDIEAAGDFRYSVAGPRALALFAADNVPRVSIPPGSPISDVRFRVDLSGVEPEPFELGDLLTAS